MGRWHLDTEHSIGRPASGEAAAARARVAMTRFTHGAAAKARPQAADSGDVVGYPTKGYRRAVTSH